MPWPAYDERAEEAEQSMARRLGIDGPTIIDAMAQDMLHKGWFDESLSPDERQFARQELFDFTGLRGSVNEREFWELWKEWYGV